jgi:hypothetical protein
MILRERGRGAAQVAGLSFVVFAVIPTRPWFGVGYAHVCFFVVALEASCLMDCILQACPIRAFLCEIIGPGDIGAAKPAAYCLRRVPTPSSTEMESSTPGTYMCVSLSFGIQSDWQCSEAL